MHPQLKLAYDMGGVYALADFEKDAGRFEQVGGAVKKVMGRFFGGGGAQAAERAVAPAATSAAGSISHPSVQLRAAEPGKLPWNAPLPDSQNARLQAHLRRGSPSSTQRAEQDLVAARRLNASAVKGPTANIPGGTRATHPPAMTAVEATRADLNSPAMTALKDTRAVPAASSNTSQQLTAANKPSQMTGPQPQAQPALMTGPMPQMQAPVPQAPVPQAPGSPPIDWKKMHPGWALGGGAALGALGMSAATPQPQGLFG